jgi:hypothetical protein
MLPFVDGIAVMWIPVSLQKSNGIAAKPHSRSLIDGFANGTPLFACFAAGGGHVFD